MKTSVIQLESHDDLLSVRDRMGWGKTPRLLLVWPRRGRILNREMDLVLLQRTSQELGASLAFVCSDPEVLGFAAELGIPVFSSSAAAQRLPWRRLRRRRKLHRRPVDVQQIKKLQAEVQALNEVGFNQPWLRLATFTLGVLAVLALMSLFLPQATIQLSQPGESQSLSVDVRANPEITAASISGGVPAQPVKAVVEGEDSLPATGSLMVPDQSAAVTVTLTNLTDQAVDVPADTVVTTLDTPAVRFRTGRSISLPAGPGQSADVPAQAALAGSAGNVAAERIVAFEGPLGLKVAVKNQQAAAGGTDRISTAPGDADKSNLRRQLLDTLKQTAAREISDRVGDGQVLLPATLEVSQTLDEISTPAEGQPGDKLTLHLRVEYSAWVVSQQDLQTVAQTALIASAAPGSLEIPGSLVISNLNEPRLEGGSARWTIQAVRMVRHDWPHDVLIRALAGRRPQEAAALLKDRLGLVETPKITLSPSWWPRLPLLPFRMTLEVR